MKHLKALYNEWLAQMQKETVVKLHVPINLVIAAPDMYEALKAYIEHIERFHGESGYPGNRCEWCLDREKEMRQALAKAEGENPDGNV